MTHKYCSLLLPGDRTSALGVAMEIAIICFLLFAVLAGAWKLFA